MRLLLKCRSNSEYENDIGAYAIVDFTDDLLKLVAKRRKAFIAAKEQDKELVEMYFWDSSPDYYPIGSMEKKQEAGESFDDLLAQDEGDGEFIEIDAAFEVEPDEAAPSRMECFQMVIDENEVFWTAVPKHGNDYCNTVPVTYEKLFAGRL